MEDEKMMAEGEGAKEESGETKEEDVEVESEEAKGEGPASKGPASKIPAIKRRGQDTPEYKAVRKNYCELVKSFQNDYPGLVAKFFQEGLMTTNENGAAKKVGASFESCSDLLDYILKGIKLDARKFNVFFSILKDSQQLKVVTEAIKKYFESLQQSTSSDSHGNDGEAMEGKGKGQDTSEYKAIRANFYNLALHFEMQLPQVTAKCFVNELIDIHQKSKVTLSRTKLDGAFTLINAILNKIELNQKWYYMLISTLEEFSYLRDTVIPEIKESYRTGKPSTVEARGARVREEMGGITRMEDVGREKRAEMEKKIKDLETKCEEARRIIAEKEEEIKKLKESEIEKRKELEAEIQKQKGVIETHKSTIDKLIRNMRDSEDREKICILTAQLAIEKERSEMKEQFLNKQFEAAMKRQEEAMKSKNEAIEISKNEAEDMEKKLQAAKDEAMRVKRESELHCSKCAPCPYRVIYPL